jgi:hypothetical protein
VKKFFALSLVFAVALFAASASAQVPFNSPSATAIIAVNATIQQSASILLSANSINFNVLDPSKNTDGDKSVSITGKVAVAKGHGVFMTLWSSELTGKNDGGVIPAAYVLGKTAGAATFTPIDTTAAYTPIGFYAAGGNLKQDVSTTLSLQLAPVPTYVPDQYTGTVTVMLQVL